MEQSTLPLDAPDTGDTAGAAPPSSSGLSRPGHPSKTEAQGAGVHRDFVRGLVRKFGVPAADVDDAAQDVFIALQRHASELLESETRCWLYGAARYVSLNRLRSLRREAAYRCFSKRDMDEFIDRAALGPEDASVSRGVLKLLQHALEALNPEQSAAILLADLEGYSAAEVARRAQVPTATVSSRLRVGRQLLRRKLRRQLEIRSTSSQRPPPGARDQR
jgi:RNA polymerase sigma-70 factor (ECF subfamily)